MYADLGPGLEVDLHDPSLESSDIFYSPEYVLRRMQQTVNLYGYVLNNPVRFVDPSGRELCEIRILAGHFLPGRPIDEVGKLIDRLKKDFKPEDIPSRIAGVGCHRDKLQEKIEAVFPGRTVPGVPVDKGGLPYEAAPKALEDAYRAAWAHAATLCKEKKCDRVFIRIVCTLEMMRQLRKHGTPAQLKLCDTAPRSAPPYPTNFLCPKKSASTTSDECRVC